MRIRRLTWRDRISGMVYAKTDHYTIRERLCELEEEIAAGRLVRSRPKPRGRKENPRD